MDSIDPVMYISELHLATAGGADAGARAALSIGASFQPQSLQPDPHSEQPQP